MEVLRLRFVFSQFALFHLFLLWQNQPFQILSIIYLEFLVYFECQIPFRCYQGFFPIFSGNQLFPTCRNWSHDYTWNVLSVLFDGSNFNNWLTRCKWSILLVRMALLKNICLFFELLIVFDAKRYTANVYVRILKLLNFTYILKVLRMVLICLECMLE